MIRGSYSMNVTSNFELMNSENALNFIQLFSRVSVYTVNYQEREKGI